MVVNMSCGFALWLPATATVGMLMNKVSQRLPVRNIRPFPLLLAGPGTCRTQLGSYHGALILRGTCLSLLVCAVTVCYLDSRGTGSCMILGITCLVLGPVVTSNPLSACDLTTGDSREAEANLCPFSAMFRNCCVFRVHESRIPRSTVDDISRNVMDLRSLLLSCKRLCWSRFASRRWLPVRFAFLGVMAKLGLDMSLYQVRANQSRSFGTSAFHEHRVGRKL
ncbi:hypothetical protein EXIGLDRAFT_463201 [Exidia glandulosa HHB12029]|uniref:Uncharacterized protein n=1 Tax=Exidia glandulosa HHB12029 TaxID=1314781 RepID=A0A165K4K9_EXIGL|nr:hypothetical protein EXIGLDRAFT_463201 [Exidia glandulosa HHB12029]